jgi:hypothetical protein
VKRRALRAAALGCALAIAAPAAHAFERQHHLGVDAGLAMLAVDQRPSLQVGAGFLAHYAYSITDWLTVGAEGGYAQTSLQELPNQVDANMQPIPNNRPTCITNVSAGAYYVFDVLRWVPYLGVVGGPYILTGGNLPAARVEGGLALALGLDYQLSRRAAVGLGFRQHFILSNMSTYPSYSQLYLRFELLWGW